MSAFKNFLHNSKMLAVTGMAAAGLVFGGIKQADAQSNTLKMNKTQTMTDDDRYGSGFFIFVGGGYQNSNNSNQKGDYINIGGQVPLLTDWFKARGEYITFLNDKNALHYGAGYTGKDGFGLPYASYSGSTYIPDRARVMLGVGTPSASPIQANIFGGLEAYPGNERNIIEYSSPVVRAEVGVDFHKNKHFLGYNVQAYAEYEKFNQNLWYYDRGNSAVAFGVKLTANLYWTHLGFN